METKTILAFEYHWLSYKPGPISPILRLCSVFRERCRTKMRKTKLHYIPTRNPPPGPPLKKKNWLAHQKIGKNNNVPWDSALAALSGIPTD